MATLTTTVKLIPDQPQTVLAMLEQFNAACNALSKIAFAERIYHWLPLQRRAYRWLRNEFGLSAAQTVVAIRKVAYSYSDKARRSTLAAFDPRGAMPVYKHSYKSDGTVSLYGLRIPFQARPDASLSGKREASLVYHNKQFFLHQVIEEEEPVPYPARDYLGCDLGVVNLLADSDGAVYSGDEIDDARRRYAHRRRNLQKNGTKAAHRKLMSIAGRQARFQRDANHIISKRVVAKARDTLRGIALEDLKGIRQRITGIRRRQRAQHANWAFGQLKAFIVYKAKLVGVPVRVVDPRHTSQTCPRCGQVAKANRRSQNEFDCVRCHFVGMADTIAARNIRARARGDAPMVTALAS